MNILILQRTDSMQREISRLTKKDWEAYAKKHGYGYLFIDDDYVNERPATYIIEDTLIRVMKDEKYKSWNWIFWADADSIVMNENIRLESFIRNSRPDIIASILKLRIMYNISFDGKSLSVTKDPEEKAVYYRETINTGHMFVKNCQWSLDFLKRVYNYEECYKDVEYARYGGDEIPFTVLFRNDPEAAKHISFTNIDNVFTCSQHYQANILEHSYNLREYRAGDFIIHASGIPTEAKTAMIRDYLHFKGILCDPRRPISFIDISINGCSPYNSCSGCLAGESCKTGFYNIFTFMTDDTWEEIISFLKNIEFRGVCRIEAGRSSNEALCDRILKDLAGLGCRVIWDCIDANHEKFLLRNAGIFKPENISVLINIAASADHELDRKCGRAEFLKDHILSPEICVWVMDIDPDESTADRLYPLMCRVNMNEIYQVCLYHGKSHPSGFDNILCGWDDKQKYLRRISGIEIKCNTERGFPYYTDSVYISSTGDIYPGNNDGVNGFIMGNITDMNKFISKNSRTEKEAGGY